MRNKKEEILTIMLNKQLLKYNLKLEDVISIPNWFSKYTMTTNEFEEWKSFCITTMRKELRFSKKLAEKEFNSINLNWGLRIKD
jgi:hypothetical protein